MEEAVKILSNLTCHMAPHMAHMSTCQVELFNPTPGPGEFE